VRKQGKSLNLQNVRVDIEDLDPNSRYFAISKFEGILYSGKNAFYANGSNLLLDNSQILIEVIDSKGDPLNVEVDSRVKTDYSSFIYSVNVYDTTTNGLGKIILVGTDINGRSVRWQRNVDINNRRVNYSEVIFKNPPKLEVTPLINYTSESNVEEKHISGFFYGVSVSHREGTPIYNIKDSPIYYKIVSDHPVFSSDMNGRIINLSNQARVVQEVLTDKELLISYPLEVNGLIKNMSGQFEISYYPFNSPPTIYQNNTKPIGTAEVTFSGIETYTGKVYRYKIYRSSINAQYDSECISSGNFFGYEILYDSETPFRHMANVGKFVNSELIDLNWRLSPSATGVTLSHTPENMIDSMTTRGFKSISGNNGILLKLRSGLSESPLYVPYDKDLYQDRESECFRSNPIKLYKDIEYVLSYTIKTEKSPSDIGKLKFYLISSINGIERNKKYDGTGIKIKEVIYSEADSGRNLTNVSHSFEVQSDFIGTFYIELDKMDITISNISIKPYTDFSYGPDVFSIRIPIDAKAKNEGVKFSAELFDINNNFIQSGGILTDVKYLDPLGVTYPFNVLAIKTEVDIVNGRVDDALKIADDFSSSIQQIEDSLIEVSGSLSGLSNSLADVIGSGSMKIISGSVEWTLSITDGGNLGISCNQPNTLELLTNVSLFNRGIETGSLNSGGSGYRLLRVIN
jgi:hypothetical protein